MQLTFSDHSFPEIIIIQAHSKKVTLADKLVARSSEASSSEISLS